MALQRAGAPKPAADAAIEEVPAGIPRGHDGRPWVRHETDQGPAPAVAFKDGRLQLADGPDAKRGRYVSRASSYGGVIEDEYMIVQWKLRAVVVGMGRSEALQMRSAATGGLGAAEDRDELQRIADDAMRVAGAEDAATKGTAFHKLSERRDRGEDLSHLPAPHLAALDEWDRLMSRFEIVGTEQFVACPARGLAGTYDRLLRPRRPMAIRRGGVILGELTPDDVLIGDLKSGKTAKYFGPKYAVQQVPYAEGRPYSHEGGYADWPGGRAPSQDWAVIPHVSHEDGGATAALHWVNLAAARRRIDLVLAIKEGRKTGDLFVEDEPEPIAAAITQQAVVGMLRQAVDRAELDRLYDAHASIWSPYLTAVAKARLQDLAQPVLG